MSTSEFLLHYEKQKENETILTTFQNNIPPLNYLEPSENLDDLMTFTFSSENGKSIFKGENSKTIYLGKSKKIPIPETKIILGVVDNKLKRVNLFDIANVFSMKQNLLKKVKLNETDNRYNKLNSLEQKQMLVAEFGTKKSKKKMQQMLNNVVEEKNIAGSIEINEMLQEKAEKIEQNLENIQQAHEKTELSAKREFLPDFNLQTEIPSKIYDIHSIISQDEWSELNIKYALKIVKKVDSPSRETRYYTDYIYQKLLKFNEIFANIPKININFKLKALIYLDILLKMFKYRVIYKIPEVLAKETLIKPIFINSVLNKFYRKSTVPGSDGNKFKYSRDKILDDKIVCHIIVLALIFFDLKMESMDLMQNLKLEKKKFCSYCKEIGCSITNKQNKNSGESLIIELKAPLKLLLTKGDEIKRFKKK